jgi:hypothetical protein
VGSDGDVHRETGGSLALKTVAADQCFQWVHGARTVEERRAYLKLAHVWLKAASAEENAPPTMPPALRLQLIRAQNLTGAPVRIR